MRNHPKKDRLLRDRRAPAPAGRAVRRGRRRAPGRRRHADRRRPGLPRLRAVRAAERPGAARRHRLGLLLRRQRRAARLLRRGDRHRGREHRHGRPGDDRGRRPRRRTRRTRSGRSTCRTRNGVVDLRVADDADGGRRGQALPLLLPRRRRARRRRPTSRAARADPGGAQARLRRPRGHRRAVRRGLGAGAARAASAPGMVTALARIEGRPLGLVANDPAHLGGAIDADARRQGGPLLRPVRRVRPAAAVPLRHARLHGRPGGRAHGDGAPLRAHVPRRRATSRVPSGTIVLRKGYGLGAQAMAGGGFKAPLFTVAWPTVEFGAMGLEGAVRLGMRRELDAIEDARGARAGVRGRPSPPPTSAGRA